MGLSLQLILELYS